VSGPDPSVPAAGAEPDDRVVSPLAEADERAIEGALRPKRLAEFIGQARVREQLSLVLESALRRGRAPDHVLLCGPPGLGKTTIAMIIAAELGAPLRITSGPAIERAGDLAAVLSTLSDGEVVFIDEIHRLARPAEEMLYLAMEDFRVDVVVGKGPGATAIPLDIAPFTLVGAAARPAARQVRLHRTPRLLRGRRAGDHRAPVGRAARREPARRRGVGDRRPVPRHPADRQPAAPPGP
jgi:Holliday junction resolvasome RuvABC ATP-dependent DNA helicase subunit